MIPVTFIGISNSMICELIGSAFEGRVAAKSRSWRRKLEIFNLFYRQMFENFMDLYQGRYLIWGDTRVMPVKVAWDFAVYWAALAFVFCQGRIAREDLLLRLAPAFDSMSRLNVKIQEMLVSLHKRHASNSGRGRLDLASVPWLWELNESLCIPRSDEEFLVEFSCRVKQLELLAVEIEEWCTQESAESFVPSSGVLQEFLAEVGNAAR